MKIFLILSLASIFYFSLSNSIEDDVMCLQGVKNSLFDLANKLSSWTFTNSSVASIYKLQGVMCWNEKKNQLISLQLSTIQLSGEVPKSLKYCRSLQTLYLSNNSISGLIPSQICNWLPCVSSQIIPLILFTPPLQAKRRIAGFMIPQIWGLWTHFCSLIFCSSISQIWGLRTHFCYLIFCRFGLWFLYFGFLIFSKLTSCAWVLISMFFRAGFYVILEFVLIFIFLCLLLFMLFDLAMFNFFFFFFFFFFAVGLMFMFFYSGFAL